MKFRVTNMTCASCQSHVEKAVKKVNGVSSCNVSLLTNTLSVKGSASSADIIRAVEAAGYGASIIDPVSKTADVYAESLSDTETPKLKKRLLFSLIFLLPLLYVSMGNMVFGFPVPAFLAKSHINAGLYQMILAAAVIVINQRFFISGFNGLIHKSPNMDTLVATGSAASYIYSTVMLFISAYCVETGNAQAAARYIHDLYFESSAMILTLITVGKMLEAFSKGKTTEAIKSLMKLYPDTVNVIRNGEEVSIPADEVVKGDIFTVKPGEIIPVDGIVISGKSAVNEAALTGESIPSDKEPGEDVSSATTNISGFLKCEALRVGEDTTLSQIIRLITEVSSTKAPIAKTADRVSGIFVPFVMVISIITFIVWICLGANFGFSIARAVSVLVISCPCALGLATPVAIMTGSGKGARNGILFKNALALETAGKTQVVVFDKTGTITKGEPRVSDIIAADGINLCELLSTAYSLEIKSEHPLAKAVCLYCAENGYEPYDSNNFEALPGFGVKALINGRSCFGGNQKLITELMPLPDEIKNHVKTLSGEGKTPLIFVSDNKILGIIAVADLIKENSIKALEELRNLGVKSVMLTGDNQRTAEAVSKKVRTDCCISDVLPDEKENVVRNLRNEGYIVAMVGDGINDAPALSGSDIGMAIGAGSDIALDCADVVLMKNDPSDVAASIRLSRKVLKNIYENLFWAFAYNCICIPIAAGILIPVCGLQLNPMICAAAMSLSSFCVVSNSLRINFVNIYSSLKDKKIKNEANIDTLKEIKKKMKEKVEKMKKTITIEGMMCPHCEAAVKKALSGIDGVFVDTISHESGKAEISFNKDVADEIIISRITDAGYKVININ